MKPATRNVLLKTYAQLQADFSRYMEKSTENLTSKPRIQSLSPFRREI